jgi:hypothetical protein
MLFTFHSGVGGALRNRGALDSCCTILVSKEEDALSTEETKNLISTNVRHFESGHETEQGCQIWQKQTMNSLENTGFVHTLVRLLGGGNERKCIFKCCLV